MGNENSKSSSSTTNPKEEIAVAPRPHQPQPQSPLLITKPQPQQPLPPASSEMPLVHPCYKREDYEKMSKEKIDIYASSDLRNHESARRFSLPKRVGLQQLLLEHNNNKKSDDVKPNRNYTDDWIVVNSDP
ncbi:PREDICTED: uncharacterized protein LOC109131137 [Camelina sativa]|uniref:Uncharacterized protein LOC109131137 n=1 Tax=Camelina sativa TaxID=90675 RepID=A0ABM1RE59_CAMSA|nr:PREDICTED: uncharacterized protein LOC109131137 [Camelina sativa]